MGKKKTKKKLYIEILKIVPRIIEASMIFVGIII